MLNFEKVRKATEEMLVKAQERTEKFWQEIFGIFESYEENDFLLLRDGIDFPGPGISDDLFDMFESLDFEVNRTCYGRITVEFSEPNSKRAEIAFQLSAECLLNNHFNRIDDHTFVLSNVHETTT